MKILFSTIILFFTLSANSQVSYGIFAGPQLTGARYTIRDKKQETTSKIGVNAGFQIKVPFEGRLSFAPSIMYNLRGYKVKFDRPAFPPDSSAIDNNTSFHTFELAFLLQHDFNLKQGHFFLRCGPSLDFILAGNETFNTNMNTTVDRQMKFSFGDYGAYLASVILQFGYEAKNDLYFYAHYNHGLISMNNADNGPYIGNRAVGFTIGKYFKKKKVVSDSPNK
jgi:Outer membrane protein beta-barrel domain